MKIKPATDDQIKHMKRFWEETPDQPAERLLSARLLKQDFLSLIARLEKAEGGRPRCAVDIVKELAGHRKIPQVR